MAARMAAKGERAYAAKIPLMAERYSAARERAIAGFRRAGFLATFVTAYEGRWPGMIASYREAVVPGLEKKWRTNWTAKMFGHAA